jgi:hypothetical protein
MPVYRVVMDVPAVDEESVCDEMINLLNGTYGPRYHPSRIEKIRDDEPEDD